MNEGRYELRKEPLPSCACNRITLCKDTNLSSISIINSVKNSKSKEKIVFLKKK